MMKDERCRTGLMLSC